jgi:hypothetical protein
VIIPGPVPVGASVTMTVLGAKPWSVDASVARCQAMPASLPTFQTWLAGLQVDRTTQASIHERVLKVAA